MVEFQFIGDVNELSDEQRKLITSVIEKRGFKDVNIDVQPVGEAGDNYVANVKRITVEQNSETFKIIVKVAPKNEVMRNIGNTAILFQNEHFMYTRVLPKFTELEIAANITEEERLSYAACYGTYMEAPNEIILLEDLQVSEFKILDRFTSLTDENVRLILKDFAKLHSLSYTLKYQEPETFETFCKDLVNVWLLMANVPEMKMWFGQMDLDVQVLLDDDKYKNAVENATVQMCTEAVEVSKFDATSKYSVIQQGDPWTNNIMFRLENDRTVKCCMIDYQISRQSCPAADLHYMIFNCTDHATRAKHFHAWIDYYYSQLDKILANFELNANIVYPRHVLDADFKRLSKVALGQGVMLATVLVRDTAGAAKFKEAVNSTDPNSNFEDMADMVNEFKMSSSDAETIKKFKAKIEGLVDSFIEFGYLQ